MSAAVDLDSPDLLDGVQGRWQTSDGDFIVVEADQVWFLGDNNIYGNINVVVDATGPLISFKPTESDPDQPDEEATARFGDEQRTIVWSDGDVWKKLGPGEAPTALTNSQRVGSTTGKTVGRLSANTVPIEDEEENERRWTKNGQLGSNGVIRKGTAELDEADFNATSSK